MSSASPPMQYCIWKSKDEVIFRSGISMYALGALKDENAAAVEKRLPSPPLSPCLSQQKIETAWSKPTTTTINAKEEDFSKDGFKLESAFTLSKVSSANIATMKPKQEEIKHSAPAEADDDDLLDTIVVKVEPDHISPPTSITLPYRTFTSKLPLFHVVPLPSPTSEDISCASTTASSPDQEISNPADTHAHAATPPPPPPVRRPGRPRGRRPRNWRPSMAEYLHALSQVHIVPEGEQQQANSKDVTPVRTYETRHAISRRSSHQEERLSTSPMRLRRPRAHSTAEPEVSSSPYSLRRVRKRVIRDAD